MIFSDEQKIFLRNIIDYEIIDLQNNFLNFSTILKKIIKNIQNSINFDEAIIDLNDVNGYYEIIKNHFNSLVNYDEEIIQSRIASIKTFIRFSIEEKKKIKQIIYDALFVDLYEIFIRKFDIDHNPDFIIKIANKINDKFSLDILDPLILKQNKYEILFERFNIFKLKVNIPSKFNEKFLYEINDSIKYFLEAKYKICINFLKSIEIKIDKKKSHHTKESLQKLLIKNNNYFLYINQDEILCIQDEIGLFFRNEL